MRSCSAWHESALARLTSKGGEGGAIVSFFIPFLLLLPAEDAGTPRDKGQAVHLPEVRGVIATRVRFSDAAKQKVAAAGLALLAKLPLRAPPQRRGDAGLG